MFLKGYNKTKGKKNDYERVKGGETITIRNRNRESPQKNKEMGKSIIKNSTKRKVEGKME